VIVFVVNDQHARRHVPHPCKRHSDPFALANGLI